MCVQLKYCGIKRRFVIIGEGLSTVATVHCKHKQLVFIAIVGQLMTQSYYHILSVQSLIKAKN